MANNIDIPDGWERIEFGYVVNLRNKKYIPKSNENLKCIELECIEKESGNLLYYLNSNTQKSAKTYFYKDDVLYGKLRPYLKKYIYAKEDGVCSSEIWVFHTNKKITSYFLFLIVQSKRFNQITNISTGTRMPRADWNVVSNFPVILPPLAEQEKIAEILSLWDKAIEQTKELITYKEKQKKGLMQNLLTGKKRLHGFNDKWKTVKLGEVADFISGYSFSSDDFIDKGIALIKISNIQDDNINIDNNTAYLPMEFKNKYHKFIIKTNDLLIAMSGATTGKMGVFKQENIALLNQRVGIIRAKENYSQNFLIYILKIYSNKILEMAYGGAQPNISSNDIYKIKISIPISFNEQKAIADILLKADKEIELLNRQLKLYTEQKKGLMQNLLTGKVRV